MSLILCLETGSDICSVAIARDGETIALRESELGRDHARMVAVFVDELLRQTGVEASGLDAVAVSMGPGSYTGLRIGVSFAKGLCYGIGKPLIGIGSLDALAARAADRLRRGELPVDEREPLFLVPMIDARRMEVYARVYDSQAAPLTAVAAEVVDSDSFARWRGQGRLLIFGGGAAKCREALPDAVWTDIAPSAAALAPLAAQAYGQGRFEDVAYFEPFYLKDFVATVSRKPLF